MKKTLIALVLTLGLAALAGQHTQTGSTLSGAYSATNEISNAQYAPVAVLFAFDNPVTGTVAVARYSGSVSYLLTSTAVSNSTSLVWVPDFQCGLSVGESIRATFPAATGSVQVIFERLP